MSAHVSVCLVPVLVIPQVENDSRTWSSMEHVLLSFLTCGITRTDSILGRAVELHACLAVHTSRWLQRGGSHAVMVPWCDDGRWAWCRTYCASASVRSVRKQTLWISDIQRPMTQPDTHDAPSVNLPRPQHVTKPLCSGEQRTQRWQTVQGMQAFSQEYGHAHTL